jgi:hypothetical protein
MLARNMSTEESLDVRSSDLDLKLELIERENQSLRQTVERLQADAADRERGIAELRLKVLTSTSTTPSTRSLERELLNTALAAASNADTASGLESQTLIKIAQNTIVSLQKRIAQKEEMVERLSKLLRETRDENREMSRLHTLELEKVHKTIHKLQERAVER